MAEDRPDLADRCYSQARSLNPIEQRIFGRIARVVLTCCGAAKVSGLPDEGPRDDPSHLIFANELRARDFAPAIEYFEWHDLFVGGDLKDAVGRRVNNRPSGSHMLFAKFFDDLGPRSGFVAQGAAADCSFKRLDHTRRKTIWISRERVRGDDAAHLPVAGSGVLASR